MNKTANRTLSGVVAAAISVGSALLISCGSASTKTAMPLASVQLGGACTAYQDCAPVAGKVVECRCTDQSKQPLCVADLEAGGDCSTTGNFSPVCRPGTRCTATDLTMTTIICLPVAKVGEACGSTTGGCEDPAYCDSTEHCAVGAAGLGQACSQHAECTAPNICPWGKFVCSAPANIGESCSTNSDGRSECVAGAGCDGSKCVARKADGQDCLFDEECTSDLCGTNGCGLGPGSSGINVTCGL